MTRRTRAFLVDNTLGKIFTGVKSVSEASPDKLIAGTKLLVKSLSANARVQVVPTKNLGTGLTGMYLSPSGALVTRIDLSVLTVCSGQSIIISVRKGLTYDLSTEISTYELPVGLNTRGYITTMQVDANESLYFSVIQSGSIKRGAGLSVRVSYYAG
jgi:hypothetical protein